LREFFVRDPVAGFVQSGRVVMSRYLVRKLWRGNLDSLSGSQQRCPKAFQGTASAAAPLRLCLMMGSPFPRLALAAFNWNPSNVACSTLPTLLLLQIPETCQFLDPEIFKNSFSRQAIFKFPPPQT
jgi:hypothetical protein